MNTNQPVKGIGICCAMLLLASLIPSGCAPAQLPGATSTPTLIPTLTPTATPTRMPRTKLSASDVKTLEAEFEKIAGVQVQAWNSHDPQAIRKLYTDDIVHFDGFPRYAGIEAVMGMASMMFTTFPQYQSRLGELYIGRAEEVDP